jgi:sulfatase modifying factor 1
MIALSALRSTLIAAVALTVSFGAARCRAAIEPQPGVVIEKPASGPSVEIEGGYMVPYAETIPGTPVTFEMIPVPGGAFQLGSPGSEPERNADEGPQVNVRVKPYWIGKCEVTWAEYHAYMEMYEAFKRLQQMALNGKPTGAGDDWQLVLDHARNGVDANPDDLDGVTCPTPLYEPDQTYSAGHDDNQPAVTMTPFAARQYTKWLSGVTGRNYRLPSEVEWEYAARAGTATAYSFGDTADDLDKHAWYDANADYQLHAVGTKEPNPLGLHDLHGNVAEWTLDQYDAKRYASLKDGVLAADTIAWPKKLYPRVIRGGGWIDGPAALRSAARQKSEEDEWKLSDPNSPHSPWWYTEEPALAVGMRLVRPLAPMSAEDEKRAWEADVPAIRRDVKIRLDEGRGALGVADETLPAAIQAANKLSEGE